MSNDVNTFINRDETDKDFFHVYVQMRSVIPSRKWLLCSLHIDLLNEIMDQDTLEAITGLAPGDWSWVTFDIGLVEKD